MGYDFNQVRKPNAKLGTTDEVIKKSGTFYAVNYGLDGLSYITVNFPDFLKDFIQGNPNTHEYFVPSNINEIRSYAFSGFPNLDNLTILNEIEFVTIDTNAFNGTKIGNKEQGSKIWVVETYYDDYVSHYGNLYNFASFESETWYVVNYEKVGTTTLTKQLLNNLNIPLTFSGLVIASDITYVTSISVSELESITQMWLKGANDLIFDLDELPNGWVYDNGTLYVSPTDYDTFIANHSGYENYISKEYSITISGSGTLTSIIVANVIEDLALTEVPANIVSKVTIPVEFTAYDSGTITQVQNAFPNLRYLETTYTDGTMTIDFQDSMWQDVLAKITSINKTLDEALCYARTTPNGSDSIIIPPTTIGNITSRTNLVYVDKVIGNNVNVCFGGCNNLLYIKEYKVNSFRTTWCNLVENSNPKQVYFDLSSLEENQQVGLYYAPSTGTVLIETLIIKNLKSNFTISGSQYLSNMTSDSWHNFIVNLGTPSTQRTLNIGATNIANISQDDIDLANSKNWVVQ